MRSINRSISPINHHQPECDRRLRLRQWIDQSVNQSTDRSTHQPIATAPAQHIQSIDHQSSNECIDPVNQSFNQSLCPIDQVNHQHLSLTHSLNPSITAAACAPSIDRSICDANQSTHSDQLYRLTQISQSISQSVDQSINQCIDSLRPASRFKPTAHHCTTTAACLAELLLEETPGRSINRSDDHFINQSINQSISPSTNVVYHQSISAVHQRSTNHTHSPNRSFSPIILAITALLTRC
eukprot:COSAG06_NODE_12058_length_1428_cov_40.753950_1_plen_240_part_00